MNLMNTGMQAYSMFQQAKHGGGGMGSFGGMGGFGGMDEQEGSGGDDEEEMFAQTDAECCQDDDFEDNGLD